MKSQISTEFIFAIGITFFIFLVLLGINFEKKSELYYNEKVVDLKAECLRFSNLVNYVFVDGETSNITTRLKYNARIAGNSRVVYLEKDNVDVYCSFPINRVSNGSDSNFNLNNTYVNLRNVNGTVFIINV